jgi:modulator of FtsH protease
MTTYATTMARPVAELGVEARLSFIRKVYLFFTATIATCVGGVALTLSNDALLNAALSMRQSLGLLYLLLFVGIFFAIHAVRHIPGVNAIALLAFGAFMGFFLSPVIAIANRIDPTVVPNALGLTSITFGSLTAWVFITRKDYSWLGGMLFVGLMVAIGAIVMFYFFTPSNTLFFAFQVFFLLLMVGYVLYDTSMILHHLPETEYIHAAINLFVDFVNMFLTILNLLMASRD